MNRRIGSFPIRLRLFLITLGVILLFLSIIFITNTVLLKPYYNYTKEKKLTSALHSVSALDFSDRDPDGYAGQETAMKLKSLEEEGNIHLIILDDNIRLFFCDSFIMNTVKGVDNYASAKQIYNDLFVISGNYFKGKGTLFSPSVSRRRNVDTGLYYLSMYAAVHTSVRGKPEIYHVLILTSVSAIDDAVTAFNDYFLVLGVFALIISGLVSLILCSRFVKPILRINEATKRMADMDFGIKLDTSSNDELGQLAESINYLSSELENKINELSIANYQLKKDIKEKERIDLLRRELLSNVSHEFKTPLAIIMGYAEGLQLNINNEEKDYYCSVISDEAAKLNSLSARLLDLAELESGAIMELSEFNLAELAEERLKTMSYIFTELHISTGFSSAGNCTVYADCGRIEEAINNLLSNAQHHTPDGGHISVRVTDLGNSVRCSVFNSGSHIPVECIERIWDSFYKVDKARTRKYGGSGLGLKIVSSIVNLHGGSYSAENTDKGVLFSFTLPKEEKNN